MNTTTCTRCQNPTPDCICPALFADADALEARGAATWQKRRTTTADLKRGKRSMPDDELDVRVRELEAERLRPVPPAPTARRTALGP